jgi:hypothetical protein
MYIPEHINQTPTIVEMCTGRFISAKSKRDFKGDRRGLMVAQAPSSNTNVISAHTLTDDSKPRPLEQRSRLRVAGKDIAKGRTPITTPIAIPRRRSK